MRKGRKRKQKVILPVMGGPLDGGGCRYERCTKDGFLYVTPSGSTHAYSYREQATNIDGVLDCYFKYEGVT
jgi:hypothetical protein